MGERSEKEGAEVQVSEFRRWTILRPSFDHRDKPGLGVGCAVLTLGVTGPSGVVLFRAFTNWFVPSVTPICTEPEGIEVSVYTPHSRYEGQLCLENIDPTFEPELFPDRRLYYDDNLDIRDEMMAALIREGSEGVFNRLEDYYRQVFKDAALVSEKSLRERAIEAAKLHEDECVRQKEEAVRLGRKAKEDALIKRIRDVLGVKDPSVQWVQNAPCSTIEGLDIFDRPNNGCLIAGVRCPECGEYFHSTCEFNDLPGFGRALLFLGRDAGGCLYCRRHKEEEEARKKAEEAMLNPPESTDTEPTCRVQESPRPPWWRRLAGAR